jgi:hypothetical protein
MAAGAAAAAVTRRSTQATATCATQEACWPSRRVSWTQQVLGSHAAHTHHVSTGGFRVERFGLWLWGSQGCLLRATHPLQLAHRHHEADCPVISSRTASLGIHLLQLACALWSTCPCQHPHVWIACNPVTKPTCGCMQGPAASSKHDVNLCLPCLPSSFQCLPRRYVWGPPVL